MGVSSGTGATSKSVGPLPSSWLAAPMADLTPDLQMCLSWRLIAECFHSLRSLSVSCFHVILGLPGPCFPSTCMSQAFLTAPWSIPCVYTSRAFSPSGWGPDPQCQAAQVAHWTLWWQCLAAWHCKYLCLPIKPVLCSEVPDTYKIVCPGSLLLLMLVIR